MKIAIYGAGKCGKFVHESVVIQSREKNEVVCFVDNNRELWGQKIGSVKIVSEDEFISTWGQKVDCIIIAVSNSEVAQEMAVSLFTKGYDRIFLLPEAVWTGKLPVVETDGRIASYIKNLEACKPVLPYIEYHVTDFCNLKCRRCGHFSNLVTEKKCSDIEEFRKSLAGLAKKFSNIKSFRLMGGEPFVIPNLDEFIYEVKKYFPYSGIKIVTNGLLVTNMSLHIMEAIKNSQAVIEVTQYPPTRNVLTKILAFCDKNQIKVTVGEPVTKFMRHISVTENPNWKNAYWKCIGRTCHFLRGTRLYPCGVIPLRYEKQGFLGITITEETRDNYSFDLINGTESGWEILKMIQNPFEFCKNCTEEPEWFEWEVSSGDIKREDWIGEQK